MNDAIGTAVDNIGVWLNGMKESEKPEKNLIVIMTDGEENSSHEYSLEKVKDMIKHQEEKYNWTFMYLGADINDASYAKSYGFRTRAYSTKGSLDNVYDVLNTSLTNYRNLDINLSYDAKCMAFSENIDTLTTSVNSLYESETGNKITNND